MTNFSSRRMSSAIENNYEIKIQICLTAKYLVRMIFIIKYLIQKYIKKKNSLKFSSSFIEPCIFPRVKYENCQMFIMNTGTRAKYWFSIKSKWRVHDTEAWKTLEFSSSWVWGTIARWWLCWRIRAIMWRCKKKKKISRSNFYLYTIHSRSKRSQQRTIV